MIRVCGLAAWGSRVRRVVIGCALAVGLLAAFTVPSLVAQDPPEVSLTWPHVDGASGYIVYWGFASRTYVDSENVGPATTWRIPAPTSDQVVYMVVMAYDAEGRLSQPSVEVTYPDANRSPIASDDSASTDEDVATTPIDVLGNDSDPDEDPLEVSTAAVAPDQGSVAINADETLTYTPAPNFNGIATITYTIADGRAGTASANVAVTVRSVNDAPVAVDDGATVDESSTENSIDVLENDSDVDDTALSVGTISDAPHGTAFSGESGTVIYTPDPGYIGTDSFTYVVSDLNGGSATATVVVTIRKVNDAPVAVDDSYGTNENIAVNIPAPGVLANDTDADADALTAILVGAAANGNVSPNADGSFTYMPATNFNGTDTFTYKANDGTADSNVATVTIAVQAVNDEPVAVGDTATMPEDATVAIRVLENDTDTDRDALSIASVAPAAHGTAVVNGGAITYTPDANYFGDDTFTYTVADGQGATASAAVTVIVTPVNDAPAAVEDAYATDEDVALTVTSNGVLANDTDVDNSTLTAIQVSAPANGSLTLSADGSFIYTPNAGYSGSDSFSYRATDGSLESAATTVMVTVAAVNDAPVAADDSYPTDEDVVLTVLAPGVVGNDTDPDGTAALAATLAERPANGAVTLNADGSFTYTPAEGYNGTDRFSYRVSDGELDSNVATVSLTIRAVNDAPVAEGDSYATDEDVALAIPAPGVLGNDSDPDGATTLTVEPVTGPANGTLVLNANGGFTYTAAAGFNGKDGFTYRASDGSLASDVAAVSISVNAVNDAPTAVNDAATTGEDIPVDIAVLSNDGDPDGGTLSVTARGAAAHGVVAINANGTIRYTPNANYFGVDSFTYTIADGDGATATATVTVDVTSVNDAPVAVDDSLTTPEDTSVSGNVLTNDTDVEGGTLAAALATPVTSGTLVLNADGSFTYTPAADFTGTVSFTYSATDDNGGSDTGTATIAISAVNDVPVARGDSYGIDEDKPLTVGVPGVLGNDTDTENSPLTAILVVQPANGTLTFNSNGTFTYQPHVNYNGLETFTYKANDGMQDSNAATVSIRVNPVNDAPVAGDDSATVTEDSAANLIPVLANDEDVDRNALTITAATQGSSGVVAIGADGKSLTYSPSAGFVGADSFSYTISDGDGGSDSATVGVTVSNVNDAPMANDDSANVAEDSGANPIDVLANDTDADDDPLSITAVGQGTSGAVVIAPDGKSVTYAANAGFVGTDTFTYTITDGHGGSDSAAVAITVTNVNDAPVATNDSYATDEDAALTIAAPGVLGNDTDADGPSLTAAHVTGPANGSLTLNPDGSFNYSPNPNVNGVDSFSYRASDGTASSDIATVTITVSPVNDPPQASEDAFVTTEDTAVNGNVLANDNDLDEDALTAALATGPTNGVLALNADGSFTYTPHQNFSGTDAFTYTVSDGRGGSDSATVTIAVNAANDPPLALDDAAMTSEDTPVNGNVLANDRDAEGAALNAVLVDAPGAATGTLALGADGSFSFAPASNFNGTAAFTYRASDGTDSSNVATVTIAVSPVNDAPVAFDDNFYGRGGALLIVDGPGVLANDADVDSPLTPTVVDAPAHGELTPGADGGFTYMPAAGFTGVDSFTYQANDGSLSSNTATVTILVAAELAVGEVAGENRTVTTDPEGAGPTPADPVEASVTSPVDGTITIADTAVLAGAPTGYSFLGQQVVITAPTASAGNPLLLVFILDGSVIPAGQNEHTIVVFRNGSPVAACDADAGDSASPDPCVFARELVDGDVRLSIRTSQASAWNFGTAQANDAPVANDDSYTVNQNDMLVMAAPGVLGNDTDAERNTLAAIEVTSPANGTLRLNGDGSFTYTPNAGFTGLDTFTYKVGDGTSESNVAAVAITVSEVNHAPVATADHYTVAEDGTLSEAAPGILANDTDANSHPLTAVAVSAPEHGTLALNPDGSFTYTPAADFTGTDAFSYRVSDSEASDTGTVTIDVTAANDAPSITSPGPQQHAIGSVVSLQIAATDVDGDELSFSAASLPGGLSISSSGLISGTVNVAGSFDVTVTVSDGTAPGQSTFTWTVQDKLALVSPGPQASMERDRVQLQIQAVLPARDRETADLSGDDDELDDDHDDYDRRFRVRPRLRFYATGLPKGLKIHKRTGIIHGRLDDRSAGIYQVVVWARLGEAKASTSFLWTVRPFNYPPQIRDIDNQVDRAGDRIEMDLRIRDRDDDKLTVTVEGLPEGLRYDAEEGAIVGRLSRTDSVGEYTVVIKVSDGTTEATTTFDWIVRALKGSW